MRPIPIIASLFLLAFLAAAVMGCEDETQAVKDKAYQLCGYVDRIGAVAKIVAASTETQVPGGTLIVTGVDAIAHAICDALAKADVPTRTLPQACPQVNGVCLK